MAGSKSNYLEAKFLNHIFGNTAYTAPATVYVALFTAAPSDAGGGTEVSGSNYSRLAVTNNTTNWPDATGISPTTKTNGVDLSFATPSGSWGTVTHWGIFDDPSAGNLLYWGPLDDPRIIGSGDGVDFLAGAFTITED